MKNKSKNKLPWIGGGLAVLVVVAYFCAALVIGSIVKAAVNRFGSSFTGTAVTLGGAEISPIGRGTLREFLVGNPKGWSGDRALYFKKIHVDVSPLSVFGDHIVVKEVTIDGPEFVYETRFVSSNITDLLKGIEGASSDKQQAAASAPPSVADKKPLKFEIKRFRLTNGSVRLGVGSAALTLPMPPISLDNLGTAEGGISPDQVATAVMRSVASGIVSATTAAAGKIGSTLGAAAGSGAHSAAESLKSLFGGKGN